MSLYDTRIHWVVRLPIEILIRSEICPTGSSSHAQSQRQYAISITRIRLELELQLIGQTSPAGRLAAAALGYDTSRLLRRVGLRFQSDLIDKLIYTHTHLCAKILESEAGAVLGCSFSVASFVGLKRRLIRKSSCEVLHCETDVRYRLNQQTSSSASLCSFLVR